jgi:hypothetical protein
MENEQQPASEYRVVYLGMRQVNVGDVEQNLANTDKELNALGAKGWELVFVQEAGGSKLGNGFAYIFKRQMMQKQETIEEPENTQPSAIAKQPQGLPKIDWNSRW